MPGAPKPQAETPAFTVVPTGYATDKLPAAFDRTDTLSSASVAVAAPPASSGIVVARGAEPARELGESRPGRNSSRPPAPIIAPLSGEFSIVLDVDLESGFEWVCDGPSLAGTVRLVSCDVIPVPGGDRRRKKTIWTFAAEQVGQADVTFRYVHPLEPNGSATKIYRVHVAG